MTEIPPKSRKIHIHGYNIDNGIEIAVTDTGLDFLKT